MATLAFFFAVSGAVAVGATGLITGAEIRDGSITGADVRDRSLSSKKLAPESITGSIVRNQSLTSGDVRDGTLRVADFDSQDLELLRGPKGDAGPQGPKGETGSQGALGPTGVPGSSDIVRLVWTAPDTPAYVNGTPLITGSVSATGGWLMLATLSVTNTGGVDENFGCMEVVGGQGIGGGSNWVPVGMTQKIVAVGFGPVDAGAEVVLLCEGGAGATFDVSGVKLTVAKIL